MTNEKLLYLLHTDPYEEGMKWDIDIILLFFYINIYRRFKCEALIKLV